MLCEGERSEYDYIRALSREPDVREVAAVRIDIDTRSFGCAPMTLVQRAAELRRRSIEENAEIDEVWCVFDVEWAGPTGRHHPKLREALRIAQESDVHVAVSNPSFELWLILHFRDRTAFLTNDQAKSIRADCDRSVGKEVDGAAYMPKRGDAMARAIRLDRKHAGDDTRFPDNNPSSGMHLLLASVAVQR